MLFAILEEMIFFLSLLSFLNTEKWQYFFDKRAHFAITIAWRRNILGFCAQIFHQYEEFTGQRRKEKKRKEKNKTIFGNRKNIHRQAHKFIENSKSMELQHMESMWKPKTISIRNKLNFNN